MIILAKSRTAFHFHKKDCSNFHFLPFPLHQHVSLLTPWQIDFSSNIAVICSTMALSHKRETRYPYTLVVWGCLFRLFLWFCLVCLALGGLASFYSSLIERDLERQEEGSCPPFPYSLFPFYHRIFYSTLFSVLYNGLEHNGSQNDTKQ